MDHPERALEGKEDMPTHMQEAWEVFQKMKINLTIQDRNLDAITQPNGPRDVSGLVAFLSTKVKMPIATLLRGNPTLWYDLSDWMNGPLDSFARVPNEPEEPREPQHEESLDALAAPINHLGQYFEGDDSNAVILISYRKQKVATGWSRSHHYDQKMLGKMGKTTHG